MEWSYSKGFHGFDISLAGLKINKVLLLRFLSLSMKTCACINYQFIVQISRDSVLSVNSYCIWTYRWLLVFVPRLCFLCREYIRSNKGVQVGTSVMTDAHARTVSFQVPVYSWHLNPTSGMCFSLHIHRFKHAAIWEKATHQPSFLESRILIKLPLFISSGREERMRRPVLWGHAHTTHTLIFYLICIYFPSNLDCQ